MKLNTKVLLAVLGAVIVAVLSVGITMAMGTSKPVAAKAPNATATQTTGDEGGSPVRAPIVPKAEMSTTNFRIKVAKVRESKRYTDGFLQPELAPNGTKLVIVWVHETNVGNQASTLEDGNSNPLTLADRNGKLYDNSMSWVSGDNINPGLSRTEVYTFHVPANVAPAYLLVNVSDPDTGEPTDGYLALGGK